MASVWEQRFSQLVKRTLGLRESTTLEALPDLMPVLPVLDAGAFEFDALRGDLWASARNVVGPVAAQGSRVQLFNNTTSALLMVEEVELLTIASDQVGWYIAGVHLGGTAQSGGYLDGRYATGAALPAGALALESETNAASPSTTSWIGHASTPAGAPGIFIRPRCVLRPGQALRFESSTVNNAMRVSVTFRERTVGAHELGFL